MKAHEKVGITALSSAEYYREALSPSNDRSGETKVDSKSSEIAEDARAYIRNTILIALRGALFGAGITLAGVVAWFNIDWIVQRISLIGVGIAVPLLGILLYRIRAKNPIVYGTAEFLVGVATGIEVWSRYKDVADMPPAMFFQVLAGIYITVRGLDNISKGITGTFLEKFWNKAFGGR